MDWSRTCIVRCTPEQTRQSRLNHYALWGQSVGFSLEQYLRKFETMELEEWALGDRYVTWALVHTDQTASLNLLSHCETWRRPSLWKRSSEPTEDVTSYGVASVYTPEEHRGNGYGRHLLRLLHYIMASDLPPFPECWGQRPDFSGFGNAKFSTLFSGVGDKFYESCRRGDGQESLPGWRRVHMVTRFWTVDNSSVDQTGWKWLAAEDLPSYERLATKAIQTELAASCSSKNQLVVLPVEACLRVHAERNKLAPSAVGKTGRHYGLCLPPPPGTDIEPFITYTFPENDSIPQTLDITFVQHPFPFSAVMAAAQREGCGRVQLWGPRGSWENDQEELWPDQHLPHVVVYDKEESLCEWEWLENYTFA